MAVHGKLKGGVTVESEGESALKVLGLYSVKSREAIP